MRNYLYQLIGGPVPQSEPITGREPEMVRNSNGGYVFPVDDWTRLERFLILGAEGGSFYAGERPLALENAQAVKRAIVEDGLRAVRLIVKISEAGRAPKNDPALFALAMAAAYGDERTRRAAFRALPVVARTGTHLFRFAAFAGSMRGWGRGLRNAIAGWYLAGDTAGLAYQAVKYRQRDGWSHRDLLRLSHPKTEGARNALFGWVAQGTIESGLWPELAVVEGFEQARVADSERAVAALVRKFGLTREMLPTEFLDSREVWLALFERMPLGALVRNLATLTRVGVLAPLSDETARVVERLGDAQALRQARLHPVAILAALLTYKAGRGARGRHEWTPVPAIVDALDAAFERAFETVEASGRRFYLGLDVSGSMSWGEVSGVPGLTPRVAAAAMAMVIARTEPRYHVAAFAHRMTELEVAASDSLADVCRKTDALPFGATDCALPMLDALERKLAVDCFVVLTDSETWFGDVHPAEALKRYRAETGIAAKLVVVGMISNGFSIADPQDAGMLDVVGFDTAAPSLITDFAR
ncbi:MAG: TROVE domain-containing protein [Acidobacteria bacterium]|nr:TROVE domain-containing protein [Acidobacteriota bacterium]